MEDKQISNRQMIPVNEGQIDVEHDLSRKQQYLKIHVHDIYSEDESKLQEFANLLGKQLLRRKHIRVEQFGEKLLQQLNIQELTEVVLLFQEQQRVEAESMDHSIPPNQLAQIEQLNKLNEPEPINAQKVYYENGAWDYKLKGEDHCKREKLHFDLNPNHRPQVQLNKHFIKKNGGFFGIGGKLEFWTVVQSNLTPRYVERKLEDFIFLKHILTKCYPHSFIPSLKISKEQLKQLNQTDLQLSLLQRCQTFITAVCLNRQLLQNFFTFRFFKQINYDAYNDHKNKNKNKTVNKLRQVQDIRNKIHIQISDENQKLKKDYPRMSRLFETFWKNHSQLNNKMSSLLTEVSKCLDEQRLEFDNIIKAVTEHDLNRLSKSYEGMLNVMLGCKDMVLLYSRNFQQYQNAYQNFNKQLGKDEQKNWQAFSKFSDRFWQKDSDYKQLRKDFLQRDMEYIKTPQIQLCLMRLDEIADNRTVYTVNESLILGPDSIQEQEKLWIKGYSKWQAYMNSQFTSSFESLLNNNVAILSRILHENALEAIQFTKENQQSSKSVISNMSCIL